MDRLNSEEARPKGAERERGWGVGRQAGLGGGQRVASGAPTARPECWTEGADPVTEEARGELPETCLQGGRRSGGAGA